jgi:Zn-finger nucleic acid-binding protein
MDCPVCKKAMIVFELDEVETDYCTECQGIWLDAGELELLLEDAEQTRRLLNSFQPACTDEAHRPCPICEKSMQKVTVGHSEKAVLIDRCPKGHGLWFDRGELMDVLAQGEFDAGGKVASLLRQMYSSEKTI